MKSYIHNLKSRLVDWKQTNDACSALCGKSWVVFNSEGDKDTYIFKQNGNLLISHNGDLVDANWEFVPENKNIIIRTRQAKLLLKPGFADENLLALQKEGTNQVSFLISEQMIERLKLLSLQLIDLYIESPSQYIKSANNIKDDTDAELIEEIIKKEKDLVIRKEKDIKRRKEVEDLTNVEMWHYDEEHPLGALGTVALFSCSLVFVICVMAFIDPILYIIENDSKYLNIWVNTKMLGWSITAIISLIGVVISYRAYKKRNDKLNEIKNKYKNEDSDPLHNDINHTDTPIAHHR